MTCGCMHLHTARCKVQNPCICNQQCWCFIAEASIEAQQICILRAKHPTHPGFMILRSTASMQPCMPSVCRWVGATCPSFTCPQTTAAALVLSLLQDNALQGNAPLQDNAFTLACCPGAVTIAGSGANAGACYSRQHGARCKLCTWCACCETFKRPHALPQRPASARHRLSRPQAMLIGRWQPYKTCPGHAAAGATIISLPLLTLAAVP